MRRLSRGQLFSFVSWVIYMQVRFCQQNVVYNGVKSAERAVGGGGCKAGQGRVNAHHAPHWTLMEKLNNVKHPSSTR